MRIRKVAAGLKPRANSMRRQKHRGSNAVLFENGDATRLNVYAYVDGDKVVD